MLPYLKIKKFYSFDIGAYSEAYPGYEAFWFFFLDLALHSSFKTIGFPAGPTALCSMIKGSGQDGEDGKDLFFTFCYKRKKRDTKE